VVVSESFASNMVADSYRKFGDSSELREQARDVIRWECRPYPAMQPPPLCYLVKPFAPSIVALPMFK